MNNIVNNYRSMTLEMLEYIKSDFEKNKNELKECKPRVLFNWSYKIINKITQKMLIHYPKLSIICTISSLIFNIYFPNFFNFIIWTFSTYMIYQNKKYFFEALNVHNNQNLSELSSPYEQKKRVENLIYLKLDPLHFVERPVKSFLHTMKESIASVFDL